MQRTIGWLAIILLSAPLMAAEPVIVDTARYDRAARLLPDAAGPLLLNLRMAPRWRTGPRERLTYQKQLGDGRTAFVEVDAATGARRPAFDAALIAAGLAVATDKPVDAQRLPFGDYDELAGAIRFSHESKTWVCETARAACRDTGAAAADPMAVTSPDGKWRAWVDRGNLWVGPADGSAGFALTGDAEPHYGYAADPDTLRSVSTARQFRTPAGDGWSRSGVPQRPTPPALVWSPDSRMIITNRLDERRVRDVSITQNVPNDGSVRPITWTWKSAMPNDPVLPMAETWLFDVAARRGRKLAIDPISTPFASSPTSGEIRWSADSRQINMITRSRYQKAMALHLIDAVSGAVATPITETGKTFVEAAALGEAPMAQVLKNGDIIWFSERTGWGHLYLYDRSGRLKRPLTRGRWTVRNILHVDEAGGAITVAANEREASDDPYFRKVYRVRISDGKTTLLTPENADHFVWSPQQDAGAARPSATGQISDDSFGFSRSGRYFIDSFGTNADPTRHVLRRADGRIVTTLETSDISRLAALGWKPPERFQALAADGRTRLFGLIWTPTDFDPARRYPVLDAMYPGPQMNRVRPDFPSAALDRQGNVALAELGMVVVSIDGRGTPNRSKAFHDESYAELGNAGHLDDHVAVIRALAATRPWLDIGRVGALGTSGGGYAAANALFNHPDFYTVGVSDAGNHDQRLYIAVWGETYNGPAALDGPAYTRSANSLQASNLKGRLMLLHGDMDTNVLPAHTLQVADALVRANKNFDLVIVPNQGHGTIMERGYGMRRSWDFLTANLIGATPPAAYAFPPATPPK